MVASPRLSVIPSLPKHRSCSSIPSTHATMKIDWQVRGRDSLFLTPVRANKKQWHEWHGFMPRVQSLFSEDYEMHISCPPSFDLDPPTTAVNVQLEDELPDRSETAKIYEASKLRIISTYRKAIRDYKLACHRLNRLPFEPCPTGSREGLKKSREARVRQMSARVLNLKRTVDSLEERRTTLAKTDTNTNPESMSEREENKKKRAWSEESSEEESEEESKVERPQSEERSQGEEHPQSKEEQEQDMIAERRRELGRTLVMERRAEDDAARAETQYSRWRPWTP
ncbi:hypothetical protein F5X68DRAFT_253646 [Plectosphaerella plurivora]|uniref:Uncharacterized protein n=1 Tax=Plectosphaerella plurivora TaxID=936078 RepID=A0A9P9ADB4_9PEZI|nr:hypothetical protein F5X68DRAFT_253646 [Plectosphaerella plurivora]